MSWAKPLFELFADAFDFIASLPEKDRQKAIDKMKAQHLEARAALAAFEAESAADIEAARKQLGEGEG